MREEDYNIDVDIYLDEKRFRNGKKAISKLEIETKIIWKEKEFPFADVHFLAKKIKHIKQDIISYWVLFNINFTNCGIIQLSKIIGNELVQVRCENKYNDWFYKIPKNDFVWGLHNVESYIINNAFKYQNVLINIYNL